MEMKNCKHLKVELDIYERRYVTIHDIDYITYSEEYVSGYAGKPPPFNYNGEEIKFSSYPLVCNITGCRVTPMSYKDICVSYTKRLLLIFDRIKGTIKLQTPTRFRREDTIKIYWRILDNVSYLKRFLQYHYGFRITINNKIDEFEHEVQYERGKNKIPLEKIKCLKARVQNSILA